MTMTLDADLVAEARRARRVARAARIARTLDTVGLGFLSPLAKAAARPPLKVGIVHSLSGPLSPVARPVVITARKTSMWRWVMRWDRGASCMG